MFLHFYKPISLLQLFLMLSAATFLDSNDLKAQNTCNNPVVIASIPFSSGAQSTCGTVNDYAAGTYCDINYGGGEDYVYSMTVTNAPVTYTFSLGGTAIWKILSVHSACPPTLANCVGSIVTENSTSGTSDITFHTNGTYYVIIDTWPSPNCGNFTLNIAATITTPANNNCSGAISLPVNTDGLCTNIGYGNTAGASQSMPACLLTGVADDDIWYSFVATSTTHTIQLFNVSGNTDLSHEILGGTCGTLVSLVCSDPNNSTVSGLTIGNTYYVRVYTYFDGNGATFSICVSVPPPVPVNDDCAGAISVSDGFYTTLNVANATSDAPVTGCDGVNFPSRGVWYTYTQPPGSGSITFSGCKSSYDMRVRVFQGTCAALTCVKGDDDDDCSIPGSDAAETTTFGVSASTDPVNYYVLITGNGGILNFSVSSTALPLELVAFYGRPKGTVNQLIWETAAEKNVRWHILERSADGAKWSEISRTPASNDIRASNKYESEDNSPLARTYYRLRSVDFDGTESVSRTVVILRKSDLFGIQQVYPSPANDRVTVQFNTTEEAPVTIRVADLAGRILSEQQWMAVDGINEVPVSLNALQAGVYMITVADDTNITTPVRVMKQ